MASEMHLGFITAGELGRRSKRIVFGVVALQFFVAFITAAALFIFVEQRTALSFLVGAVIGAFPNYLFARRMFRQRQSAEASALLRNIYTGETLKILFTVALFVIAIRSLDVNVLIVIGAYGATVAVFWFSLLFMNLSAE